MMNKDELLYELERIVKYLKDNNEYDYKLYNHLCIGYGELDLNIVDYAEDGLYMISLLIDNK